MSKILSFLLSFIMVFGNFQVNIINTVIDSIGSVATGIPFSDSAVNDEFIDDIESSDIVKSNKSCAYLNNLIMLFFEDNTRVFEKSKVFSKYGLTLAGWCCAADMYVVSVPVLTLNSIEKVCDDITADFDCVKLAAPIPLIKTTPDYTPDDPFESGALWSSSNNNFDRWAYDAIDYRQAMNYSEYLGNVKIGIIDSGFDTDHIDLKNKISFPNSRYAKRNNVEEHGTFVAGQIAALADNGTGVCGVCSNAELICADWEDEDGASWLDSLRIFFGFCRLVKSGCKVINMSLGTSSNVSEITSSLTRGFNMDAKIYSAAISALLGKGYDFVVVQSAGNGNADGKPIDTFYNGHFCSITKDNALSVSFKVSVDDILARVIPVAAARMNSTGGVYLASYSNTGKYIAVAAPGSAIYGLYPGNEYGYMSGTSMAAPFTAAVAGLIWSANSSLSGAKVKEILTQSTVYSAAGVNGDNLSYPFINAKLSVENALKLKYSMTKLTGTLVAPEEITDDDCIEISINGKTKKITAESGNIDLLIENGYGIIKSIPQFESYSCDDVSFNADGSALDLGEIIYQLIEPEDDNTGESEAA